MAEPDGIDVGEQLRLVDVAVAREYAGHGPLGIAQMQHASDVEAAKLLGRAGAGDQFAHGRPEHAALDEGDFRAHLQKLQADPAQGDVRIRAGVDFRDVHDGQHLVGEQRFARGILGEPGGVADGVYVLAGQVAVELRVGAAAQHDDAVGPAAVRHGVPESGGHRQHRDQHGNHARDADDDHAGGAQALRQRAQAHRAHGEQLLEHSMTPRPPAQRLSMRASTTFEPHGAHRRRQPDHERQQHRDPDAERLSTMRQVDTLMP